MSDWVPNPALSAPAKVDALAGLNPDEKVFAEARRLATNKKYVDAYTMFLPLTKTARFKTDKDWNELWNFLRSQVTGL